VARRGAALVEVDLDTTHAGPGVVQGVKDWRPVEVAEVAVGVAAGVPALVRQHQGPDLADAAGPDELEVLEGLVCVGAQEHGGVHDGGGLLVHGAGRAQQAQLVVGDPGAGGGVVQPVAGGDVIVEDVAIYGVADCPRKVEDGQFSAAGVGKRREVLYRHGRDWGVGGRNCGESVTMNRKREMTKKNEEIKHTEKKKEKEEKKENSGNSSSM
jgi:hypothetical protein